jgi:hypothetical protein
MSGRPDLHTAVDALICRTRLRLWREDTKRSEIQTIPSLWEQLETSAMWNGSGSGGGAFGSRPTISTGIVSVVIEISQDAAIAADDFTGKNHGSVPTNLREIAGKLMSGTDLEQLAHWNGNLRRWVSEARAALKLDPQRPRWARGIACPDCGAKTAMATQDGEAVRTPAIAITWHGPDDDEHHPDTDWKVRAVECRVCEATWWRGPDLDALVRKMLEANATRETMTDVA